MKGAVPSFLSDIPSATDVGVGVPMTADNVEKFKTESKDLYLEDRIGLRTHSTRATFEDQYEHPEQYTTGPLKFLVLNLSVEEDRKTYSDLLERRKLPAPKVEIYTIDRQFYRGVFHIYLEYADVYYNLPEKK